MKKENSQQKLLELEERIEQLEMLLEEYQMALKAAQRLVPYGPTEPPLAHALAYAVNQLTPIDDVDDEVMAILDEHAWELYETSNKGER